MFFQPSGQTFQLLRKGGEPFFQNCGFGLAVDPHPDTRANRIFVDLQSGATAVE
jgi:hypothetical protein